MSQVHIPIPDENKVERLRKRVTETETEMENARRTLGDAQKAFSLAKRRYKKAHQEYLDYKVPTP